MVQRDLSIFEKKRSIVSDATDHLTEYYPRYSANIPISRNTLVEIPSDLDSQAYIAHTDRVLK